ncbi:MAG: preprotein translocase subunit SecE [Candidatus Omnitrophica bacterium]|nr:preprotein translocase subunit SecE [Candidatus Omnitrophota bacterium]MDD5652974.1 preprotein translocase subunit SecE [Candidatus Omnitrophota bacterium]
MNFFTSNLKAIILSVVVIGIVLLVVKNYKKIKQFLTEVKQELEKVSWSTREELIGSTVVVITITAITAVFIGIIDLFLSKILSVMFK